MNDWLASLKAGDEVVIDSGGYYSVPRLAKVEKTTATQITVLHSKYRRQDGYRVGDSPGLRSKILEPTKERKDVARKNFLAERLKYQRWDSVELAKLETIHGILEAK